MTGRRRDSRSSVSRPAVTRDLIVEAALEALDEEGLEGVSTRRIAERLGIRSASLYWHIRDKEELLDLLADHLVAGIVLPGKEMPWRERIELMMKEYERRLRSHRDASRLVAGRGPSGPARLAAAEEAMSTLVDAGLSDEQAVDALMLLTTYVVGFSLEAEAAADAGGGRYVEFMRRLPQERYPTLTRTASLASHPAGRFEHGLALLLDAIERLVPNESQGSS